MNIDLFKYALYIFLVYVYAIYYVVLQFVQTQRKPLSSEFVKRKELVVLITGGARGIGLETSFQLLKEGATIIIAGIFEDQKEGLKTLKSLAPPERIKFLPCDLSSLASVRELAENFMKLDIPLHILINNAGIMFAPYSQTIDGYEEHWSVNYLGHFLLTHLLLPKLSLSSDSSCPSRVVNLASCLHFPGTIDFDDINGKNNYSAEAAYCQSKLAMVLFANCLNQKLRSENKPVIINSVHPAVAFSHLYQHVWWTKIPALSSFARAILHAPIDGSYTVVHAAMSKKVTEGGLYFENCRSVTPSKESRSSFVQGNLWDLSCKQIGIKEFGKCI